MPSYDNSQGTAHVHAVNFNVTPQRASGPLCGGTEKAIASNPIMSMFEKCFKSRFDIVER